MATGTGVDHALSPRTRDRTHRRPRIPDAFLNGLVGDHEPSHHRKDKSDDKDKDRKRKKKKDKERRKKEGKEERRSVLTGKKIKLKVEKEEGDDEREANRQDLLQFLNSTFE
ncbi:hypothetical protein FIBSPDRAFT_931347 [Athelia psychrophila]|uniref:Uncharacterized protein n=1 Tax=Athelia psychrophila TaxID=1759441 RepID=A0A166KQ77_9AGAM|nr:hypothetical protein FIBSPDRAFT_931347 [Fibularhizoctonia sp. CBS 109695]